MLLTVWYQQKTSVVGRGSLESVYSSLSRRFVWFNWTFGQPIVSSLRKNLRLISTPRYLSKIACAYRHDYLWRLKSLRITGSPEVSWKVKSVVLRLTAVSDGRQYFWLLLYIVHTVWKYWCQLKVVEVRCFTALPRWLWCPAVFKIVETVCPHPY